MPPDLDLFGDWGAWEDREARKVRKQHGKTERQRRGLGSDANSVCGAHKAQDTGEIPQTTEDREHAKAYRNRRAG